jgi:hypothetical protein
MKNKIKRLGAAISVMSAAMPALVMAAYQEPAGTGLPTASISNIIIGIMNFLLTAVGIIGVIGFAIAGILYLTAAGEEDKIKKAKSAMLFSIIGVIVALAGVVALRAARTMLGGSSSF